MDAHVEQMLFDGVSRPDEERIAVDWSAAGHGIELAEADAERFKV